MKKNRLTKLATLIFAMFMAFSTVSFYVDLNAEEMTRNLPKLLGASNAGTEFYVTFHPPYPVTGGQNFLKIYVSSGVETEVKLEVPGKGYLQIKKTVANDIIEFSLTPGIAQPYIKQANELPLPERVFSGAAIHVTAKDPIILYGVIRYEHTSDGFLGIPVSGFGKEYIVASWPDPFGGSESYKLSSFTSIISAYDKTTARIKFGGEDWTLTAGGKEPGDLSTFMMNEADVVCIGTVSKHGDLTGSKVSGNKPIGLISGNHCAFIPTGVWACDVLIEMELPTNTWGTEYHVTPIFGRTKNSFIRVFSKESNTQIFRDGQALGFIPNSGGLHGEGWAEYRAADGAPIPVVISGDKPINVTQYNPGINDDMSVDTDPFQMVLTPLEQYQDEIIFNTPGIRGGFGFDNNFINIVYEATEYGTIPDDLMFAEVKDGKVEWKQLNTIEADPGDEFSIAVNNKRYFSKTVRLNHDGVYKIKAIAPFTAYAYGHSWCDTYGFPTSVALGDLSIPDTVCPNPEWDIDCFGNADGEVTDMPDETAYRSNLSLIYMDSKYSFNYKFEYDDFVAGVDRKANWNLEVIDVQQEARAELVFIDRRGNDTTIIIEFFPTLISIHEDEYNFGRLAVGESAEHTFWVINDSKVGDLNLTQLKLKFNTEGFEIINNPIVVIIPPLDSVPFTVKFTAVEEGMYEDSIGVGDPCFFWYDAYVQANVGAPRIAVSRYDFGDVLVNDNKYGLVTVENIGSSALEIYDYEGPFLTPVVYEVQDWNAFEENGDDPTYADPWVIKPGTGQVFEVKFTPDVEGNFIDSVIFISNTEKPADDYIDSVGQLTGTGIKAELIANGYDWLRRRIDRPGAFDIAPYDVNPPNKVIFLENSGSTPVQIKNIKISEDINGDAFEFNRVALVNATIDLESDMYVEAKFHPLITGIHTLRFTYNNTAESETETLLQGIGVVPRLETVDMNFGITEVDDFTNAVSKTIIISNLSQSNWQFCDSVTITGLDISPVGAIETEINANAYGSEGFRFDIDALRVVDAAGNIITAMTSLPITLQPGEYIEVDAEFVAPRPTDLTATVTTVSDAETDVPSVWSAQGFDLDLTTNVTSVVTCVYEPKTIILTLTHNGSAGTAGVKPIHIESITFDDANQKEFNFLNSADENGFDINPGELYDVIFIYDPTIEGIHTTGLTIVSNILEPNDIDLVTLTSEAVHYDRSVSVRVPNDLNRVDDTHQLFEIGEQGTIFLQLDTGEDISLANITTMNFVVDYEPEFIKVIPGGITTDLPGFSLSNVVVDQVAGELVFDLAGPAFTNQGGIDLIKIVYGTYLPKSNMDDMDFKISVAAEGSLCVNMTASGSNVEVKKTCVYDLRKIQISGTAFTLHEINPNPVKGNADINFSVGFESHTTIEIYNSMGELVAKPINKVLSTGDYSVSVPVSDLTSGTYWVKLQSGPLTQQQKMIIVK